MSSKKKRGLRCSSWSPCHSYRWGQHRRSLEALLVEEKRPHGQTQIQLREEKVFSHLRYEEQSDEETWVGDTGATNHMSGSCTAFTELDTVVLGSVRFGDNLVAQIEGCETFMF